MNFTDKVVIITGASSGIGAGCATEFAKYSAKLSLVGRNKKNLENVSEKCREIAGIEPLSIIADITNDEDVKRIVEDTVNHYGRIDVLVNNAGITEFGGITTGIASFDRVMSTNVRGLYLLTSLVVPYLIKTKGNIINVSSTLAVRASPTMTSYCMSKAALDMFTRCLALEYGTKGVRVNSINPGPVSTEIFKSAGINEQQNDTVYNLFKDLTLLKRVGNCEEIADLVVYLASEKARCVTGSSYLIDSGFAIGTSEEKSLLSIIF